MRSVAGWERQSLGCICQMSAAQGRSAPAHGSGIFSVAKDPLQRSVTCSLHTGYVTGGRPGAAGLALCERIARSAAGGACIQPLHAPGRRGTAERSDPVLAFPGWLGTDLPWRQLLPLFCAPAVRLAGSKLRRQKMGEGCLWQPGLELTDRTAGGGTQPAELCDVYSSLCACLP